MRVHIIPPGAERPGAGHPGAQAGGPGPAARPGSYGPWAPRTVVGAQSAGGLLLPDASATASTVYAPRAVFVDQRWLVVADTGNHRVLVFDGLPARDGERADVVLGQPDSDSEGPQAGGRGPQEGLNLPTGVLVTDDGRLVLADAWNHRILIWDHVPDRPCAPDVVLGQRTPSDVEPNGGGPPDGTVFCQPFGVALVDGRFYVADTYNRRVLVWRRGIPDPGQPADVVLGQPDARSRDENRGVGARADSFRWPHAVTSSGTGGVLVADAGNHRALGWLTHPEHDSGADYVLGQPDLETCTEFPYRPQTGTGFRFPYAAHRGPHGLAVADTANNRVLVWDGHPLAQDVQPAHALGQPSFSANGENRWEAVGPDTLCWPYGLWQHGDVLAIADSGNNRVVLWGRHDG